MIRYALKCDRDHRFESWFANAAAFDNLHAQGRVECPECGSVHVSKDLMAPKVSKTGKLPTPAKQPMATAPAPDADLAEAIKKLKTHVEENSDYVGTSFAKEARAMHEGEIPERAIYGEARPEEAKKLVEDGVPALPLPFIPKRKAN